MLQSPTEEKCVLKKILVCKYLFLGDGCGGIKIITSISFLVLLFWTLCSIRFIINKNADEFILVFSETENVMLYSYGCIQGFNQNNYLPFFLLYAHFPNNFLIVSSFDTLY